MQSVNVPLFYFSGVPRSCIMVYYHISFVITVTHVQVTQYWQPVWATTRQLVPYSIQKQANLLIPLGIMKGGQCHPNLNLVHCFWLHIIPISFLKKIPRILFSIFFLLLLPFDISNYSRNYVISRWDNIVHPESVYVIFEHPLRI